MSGILSWTPWYEYLVPEYEEPSIVLVEIPDRGAALVPIRTIPGKTMWNQRMLISGSKILVIERSLVRNSDCS